MHEYFNKLSVPAKPAAGGNASAFRPPAADVRDAYVLLSHYKMFTSPRPRDLIRCTCTWSTSSDDSITCTYIHYAS